MRLGRFGSVGGARIEGSLRGFVVVVRLGQRFGGVVVLGQQGRNLEGSSRSLVILFFFGTCFAAALKKLVIA